MERGRYLERRLISDGPKSGHQATRSSREECATDTCEFVAGVHGVTTRLTTCKKHEVRVELELDDVAHRHPAVGKPKARCSRKRTDKPTVTRKVQRGASAHGVAHTRDRRL